ncbi:MAG: redox-sensing transcriptional repressor Rex [Spirochaetes bacterium]|nr:redox-sensing transcriptional repressor Rex [Spirochaetota bacterium]
MTSKKTVERLIIYKTLLEKFKNSGNEYIYSHQLAELSDSTASLVRRDLMEVGYSGNQKIGYKIIELIDAIQSFIMPSKTINIILVGVGNLGKAILRYYSELAFKYTIVACFDIDKEKIGEFISHAKCYHIDDMKKIAENTDIHLAIITVPAGEAQEVADKITSAGIKGIINFAPIRIKTAESIYVEHIDFSNVVEKVSYFAKKL